MSVEPSTKPESEFYVANPDNGQEYILFYSGYSPLSNFHVSRFRIDGTTYCSVQQYVEAMKALHMKRSDTYIMIMKEISPRKCFDIAVELQIDDAWEHCWKDIMLKAIYAKFNQNSRLKKFLQNTGNKTIVFTSMYDNVLGVGLDKNDIDVTTPTAWNGLNILGNLLMTTRHNLQLNSQQEAEAAAAGELKRNLSAETALTSTAVSENQRTTKRKSELGHESSSSNDVGRRKKAKEC